MHIPRSIPIVAAVSLVLLVEVVDALAVFRTVKQADEEIEVRWVVGLASSGESTEQLFDVSERSETLASQAVAHPPLTTSISTSTRRRGMTITNRESFHRCILFDAA